VIGVVYGDQTAMTAAKRWFQPVVALLAMMQPLGFPAAHGSSAVAGAALSVKVRAASDGRALDGAAVRIEYSLADGANYSRDGYAYKGDAKFTDVPDGPVIIEASARGFAPERSEIRISAGQDFEVVARLEPSRKLILVFAAEDVAVATLLTSAEYRRDDGVSGTAKVSSRNTRVSDVPDGAAVALESVPYGKLVLRIGGSSHALVHDGTKLFHELSSIGQEVARELSVGNLPTGTNPEFVEISLSRGGSGPSVRLAAKLSPNGERLDADVRALAGSYSLKVRIRNLPGRDPARPVESIIPIAIGPDQTEVRLELP
jgi:hypothetical protein